MTIFLPAIQRIAFGDFEPNPEANELLQEIQSLPDLGTGIAALADFLSSQHEISTTNRQSPSTVAARILFLESVRKVSHSVLDNLAKAPFKIYKRAGIAFPKTIGRRCKNYNTVRSIWNYKHLPTWQDIEQQSPLGKFDGLLSTGLVSELRASIFNWSKTSNLDHFWCRAIAYNTLDLWDSSRVSLKERYWAPPLGPSLSFRRIPNPSTDTFTFSSSFPYVGHRNSERKKLIAEFTKQLDEFLDERENQAERDGYVRTTNRVIDPTHFEWLARYQCDPDRLSYKRLGDIVYKGEKTIEDGVKKAAKLCGLKLRKPSQAGRKRLSG